MEILMNDSVRRILDEHNIFQARTGMFLYREGKRYRWADGEKIYCSPGTKIEPFTTFDTGNTLFSCGSFSSIASSLPANTVVGRYTEVAGGCRMLGFKHPVESVCMNSAVFNFYRENVAAYFDKYELENKTNVKKIGVPIPQPQKDTLVIGNDVWIGDNCTLRGGISIGTGAIIASHSVVLKDVPPYTLVAGIPAVVKKLRFSPDVIHALLDSEWWNYELGDMYRENLDFSSPVNFLKKFKKVKHRLRRFNVVPLIPALDLSGAIFNEQHGCLITDFGTSLYVDSNNRLKHGYSLDKLVKLSSTCELMSEEVSTQKNNILNAYNVGFSNQIIKFNIVENADNTISIKLGNKFLSARREGEISLVDNLDLWEKFYVVN